MGTFRHASLTRCLVVLAMLLAATAVHAQAKNLGRNLNVVAVNLDNHEIYSLTFTPPGGSSTVGNTDENNYVRPEALAFVTNATTQQLDLLVGDNQRGTIYRYPGALARQTPPNPTTGTLVWNGTGNGPVSPDALAVDGYGNLFVANSTSGHSQSAQLWVFPVGAAGSGSFAAPVLIDQSYQNKETLLEVALAPTDIAGAPGVAGGDLIVLTTSRVLAYSAASNYTSRTTLLSFPNGAPLPGGMDFWPIGNGAGANYSLLISSSSTGVISRYYFTNPLTPAPAPFASGLGTLYKLKTLFQQGNPLLFASENGAILEFSANALGNGSLTSTVTQNVTVPQGLAVSNSFTNAASVCLQANGGCNLTGLLNHSVGGVQTLNGDIVENVCTVNADPRVTTAGGVWACSVPYTPPAGFSCPPGTPANGPGCLPVNALCPGFDDTGKMSIPDTLCGHSGATGAGFSLIKTLVIPNQFAGGYVENSAVLADGSNPLCGPGAGADGAFIWAPLAAEGAVFETPNMVDITSGCGTIHGGSDGLSMWGVGVSVNEAAAELSGVLLQPLANFAQSKYSDLATTIDNLTQVDPNHVRWTDNYPNVAASVSLTLWGGNVPPASNVDAFGCLDASWANFYNATQVDTFGTLQYTADLQNAANELSSADANGNTTCDGIVTFAQANTANAFVQTPNAQYPGAPTVLNPYGQLRSRAANLYYSINTRLLGNAASATWPLPIAINVMPTSVSLASSSSPGSAALSWSTNGASGCTLTSSDGQYTGGALGASPMTLTIPAADAGSIVTYTVNCSGPAASTVYAYVNVYPPPTLSVTPASILLGGGATLTYNTNHAQGCTASTTDPTDAFSGALSGMNSIPLTPAAAGSFTYNLACTSPAANLSASLSVVTPPTLGVSNSGSPAAALVIVQGSGATLTWNGTGNTGCGWSSSDPSFVAPAGASGSTNVNPATSGTFTYTYACTGPAPSSQTATLTVVQQPTASVSPASVIQNTTGSTLTWNTYGNSGCGWTSNDTAFKAPAGASGSTPVNPAAPGAYSYTLTCAAPTQAVTATLTVNAAAAPAISVSPNPITLGSSSTLSWTINPGDACTGSNSGTDTNQSDAFTGMIGISGSRKITPNAAGTDTYALNCTVPPVTQTATLTVKPQLAVVSITVSPIYDLDIGDPGYVKWTLGTGATGCSVSGTLPNGGAEFMPFAVASSGQTKVTWNVAGVYTYTLSCSNPTTPVATSVTITNDR